MEDTGCQINGDVLATYKRTPTRPVLRVLACRHIPSEVVASVADEMSCAHVEFLWCCNVVLVVCRLGLVAVTHDGPILAIDTPGVVRVGSALVEFSGWGFACTPFFTAFLRCKASRSGPLCASTSQGDSRHVAGV